MASWQYFVDEMLIGEFVKKGCIGGQDGGIWATSPGFDITVAEMQRLVHGFADHSDIIINGVVLGGQRFIYLKGEENYMHLRIGCTGAFCMTSYTGVVVGIFEDPVQPAQAAMVVENLIDYLNECSL